MQGVAALVFFSRGEAQLREKFARTDAPRINETARAASTAVSKGPREDVDPRYSRVSESNEPRCVFRRHLAPYLARNYT